MSQRAGLIAAAAFLICILAANYVTSEYGLVPVGFGLVATAGTYFAGLTFVLRDALQDAIRASLPGRVVYVQGRPHPTFGSSWRQEWTPANDWQVALRVVALIVLGAALSYLIADPFIALASAVAFLASESADFAIYTPLRKRGYIRAALASNVVGSVVDTFLFLSIAGFGVSRAVVAGQLVGKLTITAAVVTVAAVAAVVLSARGRARVEEPA